ncbi:MAG: hypothetical protein NTV01_22755 [Bacteroidia bacterium]|nr:hypothetical protein [Bacteroidia bacterium]
MVRKIAFLALFLLVGTVFLSSCKKEELSSKKEILSFIFEASKNAQLERNFLGDIIETNISAEVAFGVNINQLIPTIEISDQATLSPASGLLTDFTGPVVYTVTAEDGSTKTFTTQVAVAPAPYIGTWTGGPIDFGMGLMRVNAVITGDGAITLEFSMIMTGEKETNSIKGYFEPVSRQNSDIKVTQTHRWINNTWTVESCDRTIMYKVNTTHSIRLYYCLCYPPTAWCFEMDLTKQ